MNRPHDNRPTGFQRYSRREFVVSAALLAGTLPAWSRARGQSAKSDRIHIACVGVGGKGWSDMMETSAGHEVVAICDVDSNTLDKAAEQFPRAKRYADWRQMLEQNDIDAVTVSTPDHNHAAVAYSAMQLDKHVYCQKPLAHDVWEARVLAETAAKRPVVTQMGIQHHSSRRLKQAVAAIEQGTIGRVSEVYTWTDRPGTYWQQGRQRPAAQDTPPTQLNWDLWLGTAPQRPFAAGNYYHPFHWRGWWDFGTGAMGDMGCHILDPVVHALQLGPPEFISAQGPPPDADSGPLWCQIEYEFPGTSRTTERVRVYWNEAGRKPDRSLFQAPGNWKGSDNGVLFRGDKGNLFVGFPEDPELFPQERFADFQFADLPEDNHYTQWTSAILGQGTTSCPFAYSGPLTETVLLGNVAYRSGQKLRWDSAQLRLDGAPDAERLLRRTYRPGWSVPPLG